MRKILLFILGCVAFLTHSTSASAQTNNASFRIISNGSQTSVTPYENAIRNADMEAYRYRTINNIISFDDGVKVELFSATEIAPSQGAQFSVNNYTDDKGQYYINPVLHLTPEGTLIAMYPVASPK